MIDMSLNNQGRWGKTLKVLLVVFVLVLVWNAIFDRPHNRYGYGESVPNIISFTGHGEVSAVPDIANVYFTITKEGKTVKEAQDMVAEVEAKVLEFLRESDVDDKDIKTTNASFYPKQEYRSNIKYNNTTGVYCNMYNCPGNTVIVGYTASESISLKVRKIDDVGKIIQGLGEFGVTDLSGPNFSIDNEEDLKVDARKKAIVDAKAKAKALAKDLGVRLGDITSFSESGNYPMPMMYAKSMMADGAVAESAPAELPKGENTISSDVTITYEIK